MPTPRYMSRAAAIAASARITWRRRQAAAVDNRHPATRGMARGQRGCCWCGQPYDPDTLSHDWPGKNTGTPHPKEH